MGEKGYTKGEDELMGIVMTLKDGSKVYYTKKAYKEQKKAFQDYENSTEYKNRQRELWYGTWDENSREWNSDSREIL
jgi:hypothetical protein